MLASELLTFMCLLYLGSLSSSQWLRMYYCNFVKKANTEHAD